VRPVTWTEIGVLAATDVPEKLYVSVFEARDTVPPDGTPLTLPTPGVPDVPFGTVIATESSVAAVAVVNVNVYAVPVAPLADCDSVQPVFVSVPPLIAKAPEVPASTMG
jgi:hypothetical protein